MVAARLPALLVGAPAVFSVAGGRLSERIGPGPALRLASAIIGSRPGSTFGPFIFGIIATQASFEAAWLVAASATAFAAALVLVSRWWLRVDRERRPAG